MADDERGGGGTGERWERAATPEDLPKTTVISEEGQSMKEASW